MLPTDQPSLYHPWDREIFYTAAGTLNWGLFNRHLTRLSVARAEEISKDTAIDAEDSRLQVEREIEQAINNYAARRRVPKIGD